jgi:Cu-processing system permease protein
MNAVTTIAAREVRDAVRSRWLMVYAVAFAGLALAISYLGERNLGSIGFENFSRTTASLLNLCLLLAPLVSLTLGGGSIAGDRENGRLAYLLAQPIERWELLMGRFAGLVLAVGISTILGFGIAGVVISFFATSLDVSTYALLVGLVLGLVAIMTGLGLLASVVAGSRVQALGIALLVWFFVVIVFDLILIGMVSAADVEGRTLLFALMLNPVEIVRVLAIIHLEPDLQVLGPFGSYLLETTGTTGATAVLSGALAVWLVTPVAIAAWVFNDRRA